MAMFDTLFSLILFIITIVTTLVIELTLGPVMDTFAYTASTLSLDPTAAAWSSIPLGLFTYFHSLPRFIIISSLVYIFLRIVFSMYYSREVRY